MTTKTIIAIIINNNDDQAMVAMVVYVRCAQSSLSGDRACMNESAVEGCAVCTRYTRQRRSVDEWAGGSIGGVRRKRSGPRLRRPRETAAVAY